VVKLSPYEEALRVPLIVRGPGVPAGKIVETALASGLDLAPTLLDYAGAAPLPRARGISLRDALSGGKEPLRDFIVSELYPDQLHPERESRIACTSSAKYMFAVGGAAAEEALWDLRNDPGETRNLAGRPEAWHLLGMMRTRLGGWMRETSDPLLDRFVAWEKAAPRLR
jgi:arylsulfatase A-like enzyme